MKRHPMAFRVQENKQTSHPSCLSTNIFCEASRQRTVKPFVSQKAMIFWTAEQGGRSINVLVIKKYIYIYILLVIVAMILMAIIIA